MILFLALCFVAMAIAGATAFVIFWPLALVLIRDRHPEITSVLGEGTFLEVKANFFNVFNILNLQPFNFNSPSTQVTNTLFGRAERGLAAEAVLRVQDARWNGQLAVYRNQV